MEHQAKHANTIQLSLARVRSDQSWSINVVKGILPTRRSYAMMTGQNCIRSLVSVAAQTNPDMPNRRPVNWITNTVNILLNPWL